MPVCGSTNTVTGKPCQRKTSGGFCNQHRTTSRSPSPERSTPSYSPPTYRIPGEFPTYSPQAYRVPETPPTYRIPGEFPTYSPQTYRVPETPPTYRVPGEFPTYSPQNYRIPEAPSRYSPPNYRIPGEFPTYRVPEEPIPQRRPVPTYSQPLRVETPSERVSDYSNPDRYHIDQKLLADFFPDRYPQPQKKPFSPAVSSPNVGYSSGIPPAVSLPNVGYSGVPFSSDFSQPTPSSSGFSQMTPSIRSSGKKFVIFPDNNPEIPEISKLFREAGMVILNLGDVDRVSPGDRVLWMATATPRVSHEIPKSLDPFIKKIGLNNVTGLILFQNGENILNEFSWIPTKLLKRAYRTKISSNGIETKITTEIDDYAGLVRAINAL